MATTAGELEADLVVAADGIGSATRTALFPGHPGLRYAGLTAWRLLIGPVTGQAPDGGELGARHRVRRHAAVRRAGLLLRGRAREPRRAGRGRAGRAGQAVRHVARADPAAARGREAGGRTAP